MKTIFSLSLATGLLLSTVAFAEPISLSDRQLDGVTAGTGANNTGDEAWSALFDAGFVPAHHDSADHGIPTAGGHAQANGLPPLDCGGASICGVAVPNVVRDSVPF